MLPQVVPIPLLPGIGFPRQGSVASASFQSLDPEPVQEVIDTRLRDEHGHYREVIAKVTAYCPCNVCCSSYADGRTSIGKSAWKPGIAAAPAALPYGTQIAVPQYGTFAVDDTGSAMRRAWNRGGTIHIDVRMTYHYEARNWGTQYLTIRIYEDDQ